MEVCERCGKTFDRSEAADEFLIECLLEYDNLQPCLCGECAVEAIRSEEDGVYFETCEKCGRRFDLILESSVFDNNFPWYNGTSLRDHWDNHIQCAECAIDEIEAEDYPE